MREEERKEDMDKDAEVQSKKAQRYGLPVSLRALKAGRPSEGKSHIVTL